MKKKILIASFFATIMLIVPLTALAGPDSSLAFIREEEQKADTSPAATSIIELTREEWEDILADLEDLKEQDPAVYQVVEQALNNAVTLTLDGGALLDLEIIEEQGIQQNVNSAPLETSTFRYVGFVKNLQQEPEEDGDWTATAVLFVVVIAIDIPPWISEVYHDNEDFWFGNPQGNLPWKMPSFIGDYFIWPEVSYD
ncbi:MAG: hypothetical protein KAW45_04355 [Thermoplasmatales archaeon]|nr:hypothetical protein [Thermoplasmatales archaeon]